MGEIDPKAIGVQVSPVDTGSFVFGVQVMNIVELEPAELVACIEAGIEEVDSETKAFVGVEIGVPLGKEPGVFLFTCFRIAFAAEHDAVAILHEDPEIGLGTGNDEVSEIGVKRLGEIGQPEEIPFADLEVEIVEDDFVAREDGGAFGHRGS